MPHAQTEIQFLGLLLSVLCLAHIVKLPKEGFGENVFAGFDRQTKNLYSLLKLRLQGEHHVRENTAS